MLVEDDNNLREIYGERLMAEGYEIVAAGDGEEALSLAVKEKPDLIIADVMMPKISGFDMLDILRQTPETKNTKVIMMTALSQTEDKERADRLGADKYLVKSQVTLEDVARVVHEMVYPGEAQTSASQTKPTEPTVTPEQPVVAPPVTNTTPAENATPATATPTPPPEPVTDDTKVVDKPDTAKDTQNATLATPAGEDKPTIPKEPEQPATANPITGGTETTQSKPTNSVADSTATATTTNEETAAVDQKIEDFVNNNAPSADSNHSTPTTAPDGRQILVKTTNSDVPPVVSDDDSLEPPSARKKVIEPPKNNTEEPSINELYEKEMAEESANSPVSNPNTGSVVGAPTNNNPITNDSTTPEATPLETVDASQIPGVTVDEPEIAPAPTDKPQPEEPAASPQKPATTGPDPNQIAL